MTTPLEALGRSALWTEAALRCLTGIATIDAQDVTSWSGRRDERQALIEDGVKMAMDWATAFERECIAAHEAEQEARRERVRSIGRFLYWMTSRIFRVMKVEGMSAFLDSEDGFDTNKMVPVYDLLAGDEGWLPAPMEPSGGEAGAQ